MIADKEYVIKKLDVFILVNIIISIYFHPYPKLLKDINKSTYIQSDLVKKTIWLAELGVNYRKPHTIILSDNAKKNLGMAQN